MKFLNFFIDLFFTRKIKSKGEYDSLTNWEMEFMFKSIKKDNKMMCPNCECHHLKHFEENNFRKRMVLYCEFCGNWYLVNNKDINIFSRYNIENCGKSNELVNIDVLRYKKLEKIKGNVHTDSIHKN